MVHISRLGKLLAFAAGTHAIADAISEVEQQGRANFEVELAKSTSCTTDNLTVRRDWGDITDDERRAYIQAVLCLTESPSKLDPADYPGAKTRYDDFVAIHMKNTLTIHGTGNFLSWHRYFTWAYEQALRNECGYTGSQPYWNWARYADDPEGSPLFDGTDTSMSGNGEYVGAHADQSFAPAGNGGGCVFSGPFANFTVNLGPMAAAVDPMPPRNPRADGFGHNPRCLRRDMSNYLTSRNTQYAHVVALLTEHDTMQAFQTAMEGVGGFGGQATTMGVHGAGHFTIAGDPGSDFYVSPGDPAFWFHHSMIDRAWTIWQNLDPAARYMTIWGGTSMMGGGKKQTLDDLIDLEVLTDGVYPIRDLVSTVAGPFCYIYE